ncbi:MAG: hypothetical protein INQ03_06095 [Candidatus Heimdallarchaeota archaeon]|nr:hypothetical protein [Candidatus Heimdallarchaeota archaeon]
MAEHEDEKKKAFAAFATDLQNVEKEDELAKKEILKKGIEMREKEHKNTVKSSRLINSKLSSLREEADLSIFVGTSGKIKSPTFRREEFITLLARELLLIGNEEITGTGGIVSLVKLREHFAKTRDNWILKDKDIPEAVKLLAKEELIPSFEKLDNDLEIIYFKPAELSKDTQKILLAAHGIEATKTKIKDILGWTDERLNLGIQTLVNAGIAVADGDYLFFPGI